MMLTALNFQSIYRKKFKVLNYNLIHTVYEKKVQGVVANATIPPI